MPGEDENERAMAEAARNMTPAQRELEADINAKLQQVKGRTGVRVSNAEIAANVSNHRRAITWLDQIEALKPGDACEFHYPARSEWLPAIVVENGGSGYWTVRRTNSNADGEIGEEVTGIYIEGIRLPGQTEAWPTLEHR